MTNTLVRLDSLFEIHKGHQMALDHLTKLPIGKGIAYVSRSHRNNGISAWVDKVANISPAPPGAISVCLRSRNHSLSSFVQPREFYTAYHVAILLPRTLMTINEKIWWCECIQAHRFRFNFGRQANRTLGSLLLPGEVPAWVATVQPHSWAPTTVKLQSLPAIDQWKSFQIEDLFKLHLGQFTVRRDLPSGSTPYITASDINNGVSTFIGYEADWSGGQITVANNGSVGAAFFQPRPFSASRDVTILDPIFEMSPPVALFICAVLRHEAFRFNYARKWNINRMSDSVIRLPHIAGNIDKEIIEHYMKSLPLGWILDQSIKQIE